jgi:diguanylate cyclase (GGDEF)-like protein/PAS domain S-box-containing protein
MENKSRSVRGQTQATTGEFASDKRPSRHPLLTEENYRTIVENSTVAIIITDDDENIVFWNKFTETLLEMDATDLHMRSVRSLYPKEEWRRIRPQNIRRKGMQHHMETRVIRKDGEIIDVDLSLSVLQGLAGEVTGSIGIITDITERKKAEQAVRQGEELVRGMTEAAATVIYLVQDGRFMYVNHVMAEISGYTSDELLGMRSTDLIHPDDKEETRAKAIASLKGHSGLPYEFRVLKKDLEILWVSERVTSIEYGGKRAVLGTLMDITKRKAAEATSREHTDQIETLLEISTKLGQSLNLAELLQGVLENITKAIRVKAAGIHLLNEQTNELVLEAQRGFSTDFVHKMTRMKLGKGFAGQAALSGKAVILSDTSAVIRSDSIVLQRMGLRSLYSVPIMAREKILGTICVGSHDSREFVERDTRLLGSIASQIGIAIENAQMYEKAVEVAFTDSLTGLYNRRYLMEQIRREMARAERKKTALSLIMLDVDGLKTINDRFGHDRGDILLKELARIIKTKARASDVATRLGGDEFVVLAPDTDQVGASKIGQRLSSKARLSRIQTAGWEVGISVSIGVASYPSHATSAEGLLKKADEAMYEAKRTGKNRVCLASLPVTTAVPPQSSE